jgi:hypothetical protein
MKLHNDDDKTLGQLRHELGQLEKTTAHREPPSILHGRIDTLRELIAVKLDQKQWVQIHNLNADPVKVYVAKCRDDAHDSTDASAYDEAIRHGNTITMGMVIACPYEYAS